jgi:hypothetical protein
MKKDKDAEFWPRLLKDKSKVRPSTVSPARSSPVVTVGWAGAG